MLVLPDTDTDTRINAAKTRQLLGEGKESGTPLIANAILVTILVRVSVECDFLDLLNTINRDWHTPCNSILPLHFSL